MADTRCPAITYGGARVIVRCKYQDGHLPQHDHEAASVAEEAAFAGLRKLQRTSEAYAIRHLRMEARKLRAKAARLYHEEPEQIAAYLTLAYALTDAANQLTTSVKARRAAAGEPE